jgi:hypothetical protein
MISSRLIKSNNTAAGCVDIVDAYDPFGDSSGLALYQFNGDATDVSGNYSFSTTSNVSYTSGVYNQSLDLLSGTSYASGTGLTSTFPLTFSFWVKPDGLGSAVGLLINKRTTATNGYSITGTGTTNEMGFLNNGGYAGGGAGIANNLATNTWSHIVVIMNTSGWESYVNGSYYNKYSGTLNNTSNEIRLGKSSGIGNWVGSTWGLDQFRVFNRELTPLEVGTLYTEELCICDGTVDTLDILNDSSCIALYPLDDNANDLSGNYSGTPTDVSYGVGEFDLAGVFNGSTSNIQLPALGLGGNQSRSVSVWVKVDSLATTRPIFSYGDEQVGKGFNFAIGASGAIFVGYYSRDYSTTTTPITTNTWYHIVVTYNGGLTQDASNTGIYVNKVPLDKTSTGSYTGVANTTNTFYEIGQRKTFTNFDGQIDQVRIFNKALSQAEVATLFDETACAEAACSGTTNTLNILGDGSCVAAYPLDGTPADLSGNYNGVQTDVTYPQGYFDLAGSFNGSSSHIDFPSPIPGTNTPASFSGWFKFNSGFNSGVQTIIGAGNMTTSAGIITLYIRYSSAGNYYIEPSRGYNSYIYYTDTANYPTVALSADTWYNVVFTYGASNEAKIYLNGILVSTTSLTIPSGPTTNSNILALGQYRNNTLQFNGQIDQVRIFNKAISASEVTTLYNETPCN